MPELLEERLERDTQRALRFETLVTPTQQANAKARLLMRAAEQTMPLPVVEESVSMLPPIYLLAQRVRHLLSLLLTDSSIYERARRPLPPRQFYNIYGRYAFGMIYMSA